MIRFIRLTGLIAVAVATVSPATAEQILQPDAVYRIDPYATDLEEVPDDQIKPGLVYKYFHQQLRRHVWGYATESDGFIYALGAFSRLPARDFDIRITKQEAMSIVKERLPGLAEGLERRGRRLLLELNEHDRWQVSPIDTVPKAYDLATLRVWEWHGGRRVAVRNTQGLYWQYHDGRYIPASGIPSPCNRPILYRAPR